VLAVLVRNGRVCVPARNKGISGTLPIILAAGATYRHGVGKSSYKLMIQLGHSSTLHWPADGQFQLLKGHCTEEEQVVMKVIRAAVDPILWGSPILWTQVAGEERLQTSIPIVFPQNTLPLDSFHESCVLAYQMDNIWHT
jgi:hypothetical protein